MGINNTKNKTNKNKAYNKNKQNKRLVYNPQCSFAKFKDIDGSEELSLDSMYKRLNDFKKRFNRFKTVNPKTDENKNKKVLDGVGDLFNELYYIYKDKYSEKKDGLNAKDKKDLLMIISVSLMKNNNKKLVKDLIKKIYLKNPTKYGLNTFNKWVNKKKKKNRHKPRNYLKDLAMWLKLYILQMIERKTII